MSIEEKAKAYDEAINKISDVVEAGTIEQGLAEWLFPELKESEGERIRKALIKYFTLSDDNADFQCCGVHYKDIVAWLEAQGEQIPANSAKTCKDEQKPVTEINPSEFDSRLNALLKEFESLSKNELVDSLRFYLNVVENDGTYKEQKPIERSKEDEEMLESIAENCPEKVYLWAETILSHKISVDEAVRILEEAADGIEIPDKYRNPNWLKDSIMPQPKQEWSEEDINMFGSVLSTLGVCSNNPDIPKDVRETHKKEEKWFNELYHRIYPQEWSEEDKVKLNDVINIINDSGYVESIKKHYITWLRSLDGKYPLPKSAWNPVDKKTYVKEPVLALRTDEKEGIFKGYVICADHTLDPDVYESYIKVKDIIGVQEGWKPSEKQLKTLERWLEDNCHNGDSRYVWPIFDNLYKDLKKLAE